MSGEPLKKDAGQEPGQEPGRAAGQNPGRAGEHRDIVAGRGRKIRWTLRLLGPYRLRLVFMFLAVIASTASALAPPYLAGRAIDAGIETANTQALNLAVGLFVVAIALNAVTSWLQTWLVGWVGIRVLQDLREQVFKHIQRMSIGFFNRNRPGALISRMTNDIEALNQLISEGIVTLFANLLTLIGVIAIMLLLDWRLALVTFTVLPLLLFTSLAFRKYSAGAFRETRERIAQVTAHLQETLSGVRVVRAFGQEERHISRMTELNEANRKANMATVYLNASYFPATELLTAVGTAAILAFGGWQVIEGNIMVGVMVSFIGYLQLFFDPIQQLAQLYATYQQGMAALDKIFTLLDTEAEIVDSPEAIEPPPLAGRITFENLSFSYEESGVGAGIDRQTEPRAGETPDTASGEPRWAVRDIDFEIEPGETIALVGSTGAGKSTLARLITRFHDPQQGRILIDGRPLSAYQQRSLRRQMGIVPQEGFLFSGSIAENIAFGRPDASIEEIAAAADAVGATPFIERLSDGLETEVGERGVQLSSGQRQLVAFARVLLAEPRILILDEATSAVDTRTEKVIENALDEVLEDRTAVVIAHRLSTIRRADRILVLEDGQVIESGSHRELLAEGGRYASLYGSWTKAP